MPPRIFLIGYRGTGKTTVAAALAQRWETDWNDADAQIERKAGQTIGQLFAQGEQVFRDWEERVVAELCEEGPQVVALGGGAVLREATRQKLRQAGRMVWLTAPPELIAERIARDVAKGHVRPSLTGAGLVEEIEQVLAERTDVYRECADLEVSTVDKSPQEIADQIARHFGEDEEE